MGYPLFIKQFNRSPITTKFAFLNPLEGEDTMTIRSAYGIYGTLQEGPTDLQFSLVRRIFGPLSSCQYCGATLPCIW